MNIIEEMRAHVEATGHEVKTLVAGTGTQDTNWKTVLRFFCECSTTWDVQAEELAKVEHPLLDQPGSIPRILDFVNAARNPTAWDRLKKSDDPV